MPGAVNGLGPRDVDLILRVGATEGDLTADETDTLTLPNGVPVGKPLSVVVLVPQSSTNDASDTMKVTAKITTADKKYEVTHTDLIGNDITTFPFVLVLPLPPIVGPDLTLSVDYDVTDVAAADGVNYGEVQCWVEQGGLAKMPPTS